MKKIRRLASVLTIPGATRAAIRWKPFSVTAYQMVRALAAQGLSFRTILDGGANIGQFARAASEIYPEATVFAFEALPGVADILRKNLRDRPQVSVFQTALGSSDGSLTFHQNDYSLASSALALRSDATDHFPELRETAIIDVPVARLDSFLADEVLEPPVLLKLDLQGYELEALRGAGHTLERISYLLLETSFDQTYEDEPGFEDVYAFVCSSGFRLLRPLDVLRDARGAIMQMDVLFGRA